MKEEIKIAEAYSKVRHYCKCGHTVYVISQNDFDYCNYCGRRVYKNKEIEFKRKLFEKINGVNPSKRRLDFNE